MFFFEQTIVCLTTFAKTSHCIHICQPLCTL